MIEIYWKIKRVGTLRSQVHRLSDCPTRWHRWCMIVQSSHDAHMILEGHYIPEVVGSCSDWGSGLGCDRVRPKGSSQV